MASTAPHAKELRADVRSLEELPPLPQNTQRLLEVLGDEEVHLEEVARVIEEVPALAARIVGLSRSAFFGAGSGARSVADAIIRVLGLRLVRSLALGIVLSGTFRAERCPEFSGEQYWGSALLAAAMSRLLAAQADKETVADPETAYLCGLLHNLGLLALVHVAPDKMGYVLEAAAGEPGRRLTDLEAEQIGIHHCQAGALLAVRWHLPAEVEAAIGNHHQLDYRGENWGYAVLVGIATRWGRQRLAGVAEPWVQAESLRALGVSEEGFASCAGKCEGFLGEIGELSKLLAGSS